MREDKSSFVLTIQIPRQLQRANALHRVCEDANRPEQIGKAKLARSENGPARDAELVIAARTLELAARRDAVSVQAAQRGQTGSPSVSVQRSLQNVSYALSSPMA